jgi:hypothetical protein
MPHNLSKGDIRCQISMLQYAMTENEAFATFLEPLLQLIIEIFLFFSVTKTIITKNYTFSRLCKNLQEYNTLYTPEFVETKVYKTPV